MNSTYEFFIAGRTMNKENILKLCDIFEKIFVNEEELRRFLKNY